MDDSKPIIIGAGDYLTKLAARYQFDAEAVWNDPKNADLKKTRPNPNLLAPGDVLYIPNDKPKFVSVNVGATKTFKAHVPKTIVSAKFIEDGKPVANEKYELRGVLAAEDDPGATDGDGCIHVKVPLTVKSFELCFPARNEIHELRVGYLDPIEVATGVRMRLAMLGYYGEGDNLDGAPEELRAALSLFQRDNDLEVTGEADDATIGKLKEAFGC